MSNIFWPADAHMAGLTLSFLGRITGLGVDDRRVLCGIIFINRDGLRWRDAPAA